MVSGGRTVLSSILQQSFSIQERDYGVWAKMGLMVMSMVCYTVAYYDTVLADEHIGTHIGCIDN